MAAPMTHRKISDYNSYVMKVFIALFLYFAVILLIYQSTSGSEFRRALQIFHFIVFVQVILTVLSRYLWNQLTKPTQQHSSSSPVQNHKKYPDAQQQVTAPIALLTWRILVFTFLVLAQISLGIGRLLPAQTTPYTIVYISYSCLGVYAILLGVLLPIELTGFMLIKLGLSTKIPVVKGFKLFAVVTVTIALTIHGLYKASDGPVVMRVQIPVHKLPESFHGMKVVQLSDIHLGPTVGRRQMEQVVAKVNELRPDLVVITGDLVEASVDALAALVEPLQNVKSKYGSYFSTGNHEYHAGNVDAWFSHLEYLGVHCLHNKHVQIKHKTDPSDWFYLAGTDDWHAYMIGGDHGFDLDKTMSGTDTDHAVILMAHQPYAAKAALDSKYDFSLILSGHTHGGQFFPMNIFIYLMNPFYAGLYHVSEHAYVYVSSGTWYYGPPIRILSTPEITLVTLLAH
ncbi:transmembrane protein with metallophosphoesterase domain-like [Amphiura filiformis]|uniref:transmembrane protein with metallophosphoesterase domain-like n=1 Tax=Amphiura filiformis TaxID=82378 RepID=UPI003B20C2AC